MDFLFKQKMLLLYIFIATLLIVISVLFLIQRFETLPKDVTIDKIEVHKGQRKLNVFSKGKLVKSYSISLGKNPIGHKQFEGDNKTPEGKYIIDAKNDKSSYYKNLGVSYPNEADKSFASAQYKSPGGDIKIHGLPNGRSFFGFTHRWKDWTAGCIAVTNWEMEELYNSVMVGTEIRIFP